MKQVQLLQDEAEKIEGHGKVKYRLWVDDRGSFYVQLQDNDLTGTFSDLLFAVAEYAPICHQTKSIGQPEGYDSTGIIRRASANSNDGAFLKAVLRHLISPPNAH